LLGQFGGGLSECAGCMYVMQFCNWIVKARRSGLLGGKKVLWDFLKDAFKNLRCERKGKWLRV